MLYPKDNSFTVSKNIHSLGLNNNMTTTPTYGSAMFKAEMATSKNELAAGALGGLGDLTVINTGHPWVALLFGGLLVWAFAK